MSEFNKYAQELNKEFTTAKEKYNEVYQRYKEAEAADKAATDPAEKITTAANLKKAKEDLKTAQREIWPNFQKKRDKLGRELQTAVNLSDTVDPEELDKNTVTLLESGTLTPDDYESLADKFEGNATMARMIGKAASDYGNTHSGDLNTVRRMNEVRYKCDHSNTPVMNEWNKLTTASEHYSGEYHRNPDPELVCNLADHWSGEDIQTAIKNF